MRERPVSNPKDQLDAWSPARILAVMLHPTELNKADEILAAGQVQSGPLKDIPGYYDLAERSFRELINKDKPSIDGRAAGDVLVVMKTLYDHHLDDCRHEPSLKKANTIVGGRRLMAPTSVQLAWDAYRSVSHLWASFLSLEKVNPEPWDDEQFVRNLLLGADAFLQFAASHRTGRGTAKKIILPKEEAWQVEGANQLGGRANVLTSPLSDRDLRALKNYRAPKAH